MMTIEEKKKYKREYYLKNQKKILKKKKKYNDKNKQYRSKYYFKNKIKSQELHLKNTYNLTVDEYNKIFQDQNGCCKICGKHQTEFKAKLAVDHCHKTGKIRGLLCNNCNRGIGHLKESILLLKNAIKYINDNI